MKLKKADTQLLCDLGFTKTQAKIYLALLLFGKRDARSLANCIDMHRTEVYRTLDELQEKGFVDKEIGVPLKFNAVHPSLGLQNALNKKADQMELERVKVAEFVGNFEQYSKMVSEEQEAYSIKIINGRKRIIRIIKDQHDAAKESIDIISVLPRWLQILDECLQNYNSALDRGVNYRVIIGLLSEISCLPQIVKGLLERNNFKIKTIVVPPSINSAVFDGKQATFSYYPSKSLGDSPLIITSHPSFLALTQGYFETLWDTLPEKHMPATKS